MCPKLDDIQVLPMTRGDEWHVMACHRVSVFDTKKWWLRSITENSHLENYTLRENVPLR